jgi:hypothetical protein
VVTPEAPASPTCLVVVPGLGDETPSPLRGALEHAVGRSMQVLPGFGVRCQSLTAKQRARRSRSSWSRRAADAAPVEATRRETPLRHRLGLRPQPLTIPGTRPPSARRVAQRLGAPDIDSVRRVSVLRLGALRVLHRVGAGASASKRQSRPSRSMAWPEALKT